MSDAALKVGHAHVITANIRVFSADEHIKLKLCRDLQIIAWPLYLEPTVGEESGSFHRVRTRV